MSIEIRVIDLAEALFVSPQDKRAVVYGRQGAGWALVVPNRSREGITARPIVGAQDASDAEAVHWARRFMEINHIDWLGD
jgi:hypothetical protein